MALRNTALLALVGAVLLTVLFLADLVIDVSGLVNGVIPAIRVLASFIHVVGSLSLAVCF